jgi:hypothetical protein
MSAVVSVVAVAAVMAVIGDVAVVEVVAVAEFFPPLQNKFNGLNCITSLNSITLPRGASFVALAIGS